LDFVIFEAGWQNLYETLNLTVEIVVMVSET
jgi:hypothetical protein